MVISFFVVFLKKHGLICFFTLIGVEQNSSYIIMLMLITSWFNINLVNLYNIFQNNLVLLARYSLNSQTYNRGS